MQLVLSGFFQLCQYSRNQSQISAREFCIPVNFFYFFFPLRQRAGKMVAAHTYGFVSQQKEISTSLGRAETIYGQHLDKYSKFTNASSLKTALFPKAALFSESGACTKPALISEVAFFPKVTCFAKDVLSIKIACDPKSTLHLKITISSEAIQCVEKTSLIEIAPIPKTAASAKGATLIKATILAKFATHTEF